MSDAAAREILVAGARALARGDGRAATLRALVEVIADQVGVGSAAIVVLDGQPPRLAIAADYGLGDAARAGLAEAIQRPDHPIARTVAEPVPTFDVHPVAPGGPALRTHVPLTVTRGGTPSVLGVLALAHDAPIDPQVRGLVLAGADLAAAAIELHRPG